MGEASLQAPHGLRSERLSHRFGFRSVIVLLQAAVVCLRRMSDPDFMETFDFGAPPFSPECSATGFLSMDILRGLQAWLAP